MPEKVLDMFNEMPIKPDSVVISIFFNACAKLANAHAMRLGKDVLEQLPGDILTDGKLVNAAIDMFMKCSDVSSAEHLFERLQSKSPVTYGAMMQGKGSQIDWTCWYWSSILGYTINGLPGKALDVFEEISFELNEVLYAIVYKACASLANERAIRLGMKLAERMPKRYLDDIVLIGSMLHMFMKFGEVKYAEHGFSQMKKRNIISFGVMLNGYNHNEEPHKALQLFEQMKREKISLNESTAVSLVGACAQIGLRSICQPIVNQIPDRLLTSPRLTSSLIDMWVTINQRQVMGDQCLFSRAKPVPLVKPKRFFN